MGAELQVYSFKPCTKAELEKKWEEARKQAGYESGHGGYSGSIIELHPGLDFHNKVFNSLTEAENYISDTHPKWDAAIAVQFRKGEMSERSKNKREALYQKKEAANRKVVELRQSIVKRFNTSKSKMVGCKNCGSKINRTYLHNAACVCGASLLSLTDHKRINALVVKADAARKEYDNYKPEIETKDNELFWACGGWCSS